MAKNLVIVESPAKVKTIKKFLGSSYQVMASMGHVRDLPKSRMVIDVENDFEPRYITIRGKGELVASLRKEAKKAERIYLATDPDREGEAISWHLTKALKIEPQDTDKKVARITFNEITKNAVKNSLKNSRAIDMNLVDAQQARRVLDRIVGYGISPLLWAKVKRGLSAGRVQSVALRIICDREDEINAFIPEEYWTIDAEFDVEGEKAPITAHFYGMDGEKLDIKSERQANEIVSYCKGSPFRVSESKSGSRTKKPPLPFTTSTLQQEASSQLNFSTSKTMRVAQQLYEGVEVKGRGTIALISYLRTDSTRVSEEAGSAAKDYINQHFGQTYLSDGASAKRETKKIQDAHEAIRPTDINMLPEDIKDSLSREQFRLYQLIWKRFLASQMAGAKYETKNIKITASDRYIFSVSASKLVFDGFMSVYNNEEKNQSQANLLIGDLNLSSKVSLRSIDPKQHFTQPPAHYTEASLVRTLEELGIGRPSTYAPTITTILARHYITKEQRNLYATALGQTVNSILVEAFPEVVDVNFTANLENQLDEVEEGKVGWKSIIENFYPDLEESVKKAEKEIAEVKLEDEKTDVICENCGRNMVIKYGPHGKFLACPGFPDCKNTKPYYEKIGVKCPKCGREIVMKTSRKGRRYYGCEGYPECDFMSWPRPSATACPKCGSLMVRRGRKIVCTNEKCRNVMEGEDEEV